MGNMVDTHTHICDRSFQHDIRQVLERARNAGVHRLIAVSETLDDARKNLQLAAEYPEIIPAAGLYPTQIDLDQTDLMEKFIRDNVDKLVCIGEVGLDHWKIKDEGQRELQRQIFERFIDLSLELDLPLNVHSRSAGRHVIACLLEKGATKVQLHAFDGKASAALPALDAGYYFSIPPSIVRSRQKQKLVKRLPLDSILLETDSPVLSPDGSERNEPANLMIALKSIAEIKEISENTVREAVIENTYALYGI